MLRVDWLLLGPTEGPNKGGYHLVPALVTCRKEWP